MKINVFIKNSICTLLFLSASFLFSQRAEAPENKFDVGSIKWMKTSDPGTLIVSTSKGIYGIKPYESQPAFLFDRRKNIKEENFHLQSKTPYACYARCKWAER